MRRAKHRYIIIAAQKTHETHETHEGRQHNDMNQKRLAQVRTYMERDGLEQILVTGTAPVYYLTGCWIEPMERMLALYLDKDGTAALYANALFGLEPQEGLELFIHTDSDDPTAALSKRLRSGTLGVDKSWASRFLIPLVQARPDVRPVLGSAPVDDARRQKDPDEIAAMRAASQINDQVMAETIAAIRAGITEEELASVTEQAYRRRGADRNGEGLIVSFGPNGADPHHSPSSARLQKGDSIVMDIYKPIHRYWCDMTRTAFFQEADEEHRIVYETVRRANAAAEAIIRPGVPMCDIDAAARRVIEEAGYGSRFTHRLGHGCGLDCHEPPDNSPSCHVLAQAGMVFSVEPGIYLPGKFGVRIEDLVLVTDTGCEVLNAYPKDLLIVE